MAQIYMNEAVAKELKSLVRNLKDKHKLELRENLLKMTTTDENGFVRIDPRFLSNI